MRGIVIAACVACLACLASAASGCVMPFMIPPVKAEVGAASQTGQAPTNQMIHVAVGSHLASGTRSAKQAFDIGAGWVFSHDFHDEEPSNAHGFYLDGTAFISRHRTSRTGLGGRGEMMWSPDGMQMALLLRVDQEYWKGVDKPFSSNGRCGTAAGVHVGTAAIGFFTEAGVMRLPSGEAALTATAGLTFRLPAAYGIAIGIPGCK